MSFNYANTAATATRLLGRFGQRATLHRDTPGSYDPATGSVGTVRQSWPAVVAITEYAQRDIDGTLVQQGDRRILMNPRMTQAPRSGDVLELADGTRLALVSVTTHAPAGVAVLYEGQARGEP